ncbi:hypothetical protein HRN72_001500 [Salmonella enterica]|uniref:Uncharacterized protein n=2 Tax=Salmonella enterica TaxID=28901 RepID=A0A5V5HI51_SALER|nr:hypothetical protein [Salmonella enterica]EBS6452301.1 hypothetical protein [Salmonella enterica subsp. enterica serovar Offa]ECG1296904.1 hypothetical protein [Salmonella enterica subsp. enterica]EAV2396608.1 hypothetical protein [Salmonella enterica]EBB2613193.1 hypothetical protein [Salmonella enterica]
MSSNKITQDRYEMVYIKQKNVVIVHREPYTVSILTREQAEDFGYNISKMKEYENISINGIPEDGYELVEYYDDYQEPDITRGEINHDNPELDKMITDFLNKN